MGGRHAAVQLRHDRPTQGHRARGGPCALRRRRGRPAPDDDAPIQVRRRFGLPVDGAAVPRGPAVLCDQHALLRRHRGVHAQVRCGRVAGADRALPRHPQPVGADHVHPVAEAAGRIPRSLRPVQPPRGDPCRGAVSRRGQAPHDRLVGPDRGGVLRRQRGQRPDLHRQPRSARAPRLGGPRRAGRAAHLRRRRQRARGGPGRADLFRARQAALSLSPRPRQDPRGPASAAPELDRDRRHRPPRHGRLPVPDRPALLHDHFGRGEHLPAGHRGCAGPAPQRAGRRRDRRARRRDGRGREGRHRARTRRGAHAGLGRSAHRLPARQGRELHAAALGGLHRRDAAPSHRKALQARAARALCQA
ncbi:hypothetical protein D3C85_1106350 [compost metagenome]